MGIQGLLPLLKSIMVSIHLKDLEGCCVAVDTYSWLHKGALSCSRDLCKGQPTSRHIDYCMHRVNLLRHYGVRPILIFDGGLLPMKSEQENKRARARKENLARAIEHESNGNSAAAYECYQKAVDISPSVAYELIQVLKQENVHYIVAPYEADAQMTLLAVSKLVDAVITEDSDLIAFGCPRIIYKMDKFGQGVEFRYSRLQQNKELNFTGFSKQMLLEMCILSGCDYLHSLPGMGLKKAHTLVKKFKSYDQVIKHLKYNNVDVSPLYEESFKKAILTFQHQRVYDPDSEDIVHLTELSDNVGDDLEFLGPSIPPHIAKGIARGDLDPFTKMPFQEECVTARLVLDGTYRLKNFKPEGERKKLDLPAQKNLLTNYFCFASLEAKRKFRVPRITPKHPNPRSDTYCPGGNITVATNSCQRSFSPVSLTDDGNLGIVPCARDSVDDGVSAKTSVKLDSLNHGLQDKKDVGDRRSLQHPLLKQSRNSIHKPCIASQKEHGCNSASDRDEEKTRVENKNVIMSSNFQHRSAKENDLDNKNELLLIEDDAATDTCGNIFIKHEYNFTKDAGESKKTKKRNVNIRSSYFQHNFMKENDNKKFLDKNGLAADTCRSTILEHERNADEGKMRTVKRNVIVRSAYFRHELVKENDRENKYEKLLEKVGVVADTGENTLPENASSGNNYFKGTTTKRKDFPIDSIQIGDMNHKYMRTNASVPIQGNCTTNSNDSDGKFGSNISHLSQYSDIAEKSMERFVSVISSFRCSSSGSRASGLRAPLKDVRNTCPIGSTVCMDLNKFAYTPTNRKAASRRFG